MMKMTRVVFSSSIAVRGVVSYSLKLCNVSRDTRDMERPTHPLESPHRDGSLADRQPVVIFFASLLRKKAKRKTSVSNRMTVGAGALSIQKLR